MKLILEAGAIMLLIWSICEFGKVWWLKWRYRNKNAKIFWTSSKMCYVSIGVGIALGVICIILKVIDTRSMWLFLAAVCMSGASREFEHSYCVETDDFVNIDKGIYPCTKD